MDNFHIEPETKRLLRDISDAGLCHFVEVELEAYTAPTESEQETDTQIELLICACLVVFVRMGSLEYLERAIQLAEEWMAVTPVDHLQRERRLQILDMLSVRIGVHREKADLFEAKIGDRIGGDGDKLHGLLVLFNDLSTRLEQTEGIHKLNLIIDIGNRIMETLPLDHPKRHLMLANLGALYGKRSDQTKTIKDYNHAIELSHQALGVTPLDDGSSRAIQLRNLITLLGILSDETWKRPSDIRKRENVEHGISWLQEAIEALPGGNDNRPGLLRDLGILFEKRFWHTENQTDLSRSIKFLNEAINANSADHPERPKLLSLLGAVYAVRFRESMVTDMQIENVDLDMAIEAFRNDITTTTPNYLHRAELLNICGMLLGERYTRNLDVADLENAIQFSQEAVDIMPKTNFKRATWLNGLGNAISLRYQTTGAINDLEKAIQVHRQAVDAHLKDDPYRAMLLHNYGGAIYRQFLYSQAITYLEEAIRLVREAVICTPKDDINRAMYLITLGTMLGGKYLRVKDIKDLEENIRLCQEAVDLTPKTNPDRAIWLNGVGTALSTKIQITGKASDIEECNKIYREAISITPENHPYQAIWLRNLGILLREGMRVDHLTSGRLDNRGLEEAIKINRECVEKTPEGHPKLAESMHTLGDVLRDRYKHSDTNDIADLKAAEAFYQSALNQSNSSTITRIRAGRKVIDCCSITKDWEKALQASAIIVDLIPKLTSRSLENTDKQHVLGDVAGIASNTAAAALNAGKGALIALEFLEKGRGVLAASIEDMRTDTLGLQEKFPELARQFVCSRNEIELPITPEISSVGKPFLTSWQDQADRRDKAAKELDSLVVKIRKKPGFEDFLGAPSPEELQAAARYGPVVVINVSEYRCDAILLQQTQIRFIPLPNLTTKNIKERSLEGKLGSPNVLKWLWDAAANPILQKLGFTERYSGQSIPHVWWICTGLLGKFPIHAAGYHTENSGRTVLDRVMSSYSSSVKAIIHGRRRSIPVSMQPAQALLVAMPDTPETSNLYSVAKEIEMLNDLCKSMKLDPIKPEERRKQNILTHLLNCKIFHFAGHGRTDPRDPSKSYLLLEDWKSDPLTVATLLQANIRQRSPFLAYLSACGTGQIRDEKFLDESIHLISACQLAGFRHVIGTLWEVNDRICVDMGRITYERMEREGMTDNSVCRGLHAAIRELRDRWLSEVTEFKGERLVEMVDMPLTEERGAKGISDKDHRDKQVAERHCSVC